MEKGTIKKLKKNYRYTIVHYRENYYLIDVNKLWLGYIFPLFNWLIPIKAIKLDKELPQDLMKEDEEKGSILGVLGFLGIMAFQQFVLTPILSAIPLGTDFEQGIIILSGFATVFVLYKIYISIKSKKELLDHVDFEQSNIQKLIVRPVKTKLYFMLLILNILFTTVLIASVYGFLFYEEQIVFLFTFLGGMFFISVYNWLSLPDKATGSDSEYSYRVKLMGNVR